MAAFDSCKQRLADATLLAHPRQNARLTLTTDPSDTAWLLWHSSPGGSHLQNASMQHTTASY